MNKLLLFLLFTSILSSCLVDIRPQVVQGQKINQSEAVVNEWVNKFQKAHHVTAWKKEEWYSIKVEDSFYSLIGKTTNPFKANPANFTAYFQSKIFNGNFVFENGKQEGQVWGISNGKTYEKGNTNSAETLIKKNNKIKFCLPTYQFLFELPNRITEADILLNGGKIKYNEVNYQLIYATWKSPKPQRKVDQYVLWINEKTHLIDIVQYTIRDKASFVKGTAIYKNYQNINGRTIPGTIEIKMNIKKEKLLHKIAISDFKILESKPEWILELKDNEK